MNSRRTDVGQAASIRHTATIHPISHLRLPDLPWALVVPANTSCGMNLRRIVLVIVALLGLFVCAVGWWAMNIITTAERDRTKQIVTTPLENAILERIATAGTQPVSAKDVFGQWRRVCFDGPGASSDPALAKALQDPRFRHVYEGERAASATALLIATDFSDEVHAIVLPNIAIAFSDGGEKSFCTTDTNFQISVSKPQNFRRYIIDKVK